MTAQVPPEPLAESSMVRRATAGRDVDAVVDAGRDVDAVVDAGREVDADADADRDPSGADTGTETREAVQEAVRRFLDEVGIEWELGGRAGEIVVTLPGEKKLKTVCSLVVGEQSLSISAFVVRNPDENHQAVYAYLLRRNLKLPGLAYGIDKSGDVYVTGRVPLEAANAAYLDQIFGVVLEAADSAFNELLALGFLTSMKKEWAWRMSRGQSTRNLEAFRHLLE